VKFLKLKLKSYTIQVIPDDSRQIKQYHVSATMLMVIRVVLAVFIVLSVVFIAHIGKMTAKIARYETLKKTDAQLVKVNANYEEVLTHLDSLWLFEERIQNILGTFLENDSNKINSLIDKSKFVHTPPEKIEVDFEGLHGWKSYEERQRIERLPNILPVVGMISKTFNEETGHNGTDFAAKVGNPVFATGTGTVEFAAEKDELGNTIIVNHGNGYVTSYSHLKDMRTRKGRQVKKGDIIGTIGTTGNASGPHLHYTITKDGVPQNPESFFNY